MCVSVCCPQQGVLRVGGVLICVGVCVPALRAELLYVHSTRNTQQCLPWQAPVVMWSLCSASLGLLVRFGLTLWLDNLA